MKGQQNSINKNEKFISEVQQNSKQEEFKKNIINNNSKEEEAISKDSKSKMKMMEEN